MTETDILDRLTTIVREVLGDDAIVLMPDSVAEDFPDWDSFNHIAIIVAAELKFGIKFRTTEIEALRNVGEFAQLIARKLDQAKAGEGQRA